VVSDRLGDLDASLTDSHGLFHSDTRYLSRFRLTVNEVSPTVLSVDDSAHYAAQFFLVQPTGSVIDDSQLAVLRRRSIDLGFREEITVLSHSRQPMDVDLQIEVAADCADLFEVKEHLDKLGTCYEDIRDGGLLLGYRRGGFCRETLITTSDQSCTLTPKSLRFAINLPPRGEWSVTVDVAVASDMLGDTRTSRRYGGARETRRGRPRESMHVP
ncbi:MAG: amylo-alpha-1,6-glucosidase, partial [Acidimicrobiia bacterium]|nr:amylo-alpha-1,6-glucosidase [Acidimicrobiia bacterium]